MGSDYGGLCCSLYLCMFENFKLPLLPRKGKHIHTHTQQNQTQAQTLRPSTFPEFQALLRRSSQSSQRFVQCLLCVKLFSYFYSCRSYAPKDSNVFLSCVLKKWLTVLLCDRLKSWICIFNFSTLYYVPDKHISH